MRTHQYRDIICATCECCHLSADDIFEMMKKQNPTIGKATIYRNIESLVEQWHLRKIPWSVNGKIYYECQREPHAHLVDEKSGILCDFPIENISIRDIPEGYEVSEVRVEIKKK